ncbi:nuclear cap-binding protein subunit [Saccharomycopsis crataegensis]|uniref:Nuclear cap-binding protein subunit 2 n=1 Tax=Saccharomycopsis crataegensis TaxID=43959 RepID=A0AAV5QFT9_9ASCO|nr:nuclear cap-binding protein subunit [Saccharomycopsis crataegensis]
MIFNVILESILVIMNIIDKLESHDFNYSGRRTDKPSKYLMKKAKRSAAGLDDLEKSLRSSTVYVGGLSIYTTEEQIHELFKKCGEIERVIMGLDRFNRTPCGFCFVVYKARCSALNCVKYLKYTKLDDEVLEIDIDPGFQEGRQFGRGYKGGQVRNDRRGDVFEPGKGN